jgi:hypothetical protein
MKLLLGDFNAEAGREDIFKPTIGNESLHETSNGNGVRVQCSHTVKFINTLGLLLMAKHTIRLIASW